MKWDLQLFADEGFEEGEDVDVVEDDGEENDDAEDLESSEEVQEATISQSELDRIIDRRLARERKRREKELEKSFGTSDMKQVNSFYNAGKLVAERAGRSPEEVVSRLHAQMRGNPKGETAQSSTAHYQTTPEGDAQVQEELREIRELLSHTKEEALQAEKTKARKEFGELYNKYEEDILDKSEDDGLSITDAAAIVLRPHLRDYYKTRQQEKQSIKKNKRVESGDGAPPSNDGDFKSKLSKAQMIAAKKMGVPLKDYYLRAKAAGKVE